MQGASATLRNAAVAPCTATTTAQPVTLLALKGKPSRFPACTAWARQGHTLRPEQHNLHVLEAEQVPDRLLRLPAAAETASVAIFAAALETAALGLC